MDKSIFAAMPTLTPALGYASMIGLGLFSLALSYGVKTLLVRNTHDFIIADRRVGFGFGVGSVIAVWTWAMAVMMGTLNTLMITVPAAIVVAAVYAKIPGGTQAVFDAAGAADARNLSVLRPDAAAGFGITLAFGLLAATV